MLIVFFKTSWIQVDIIGRDILIEGFILLKIAELSTSQLDLFIIISFIILCLQDPSFFREACSLVLLQILHAVIWALST